jgi:hypothetical protein
MFPVIPDPGPWPTEGPWHRDSLQPRGSTAAPSLPLPDRVSGEIPGSALP